MEEPKTELIATYGGLEGGDAPGAFRNPAALATDCAGNLIVCDSGNHRIQKLDRNGNLLWVRGGQDRDGRPKGGTAPAEFLSPRAVATDAQGSIYVCDSHNCRVKKYDAEGTLVMMFGAQGSDEGQFGGMGPEGIDVDDEGLIFVADSHTIRGGNHRVQIFDPGGHYLGAVGSFGTSPFQFAGSVPIREYGLDFGPGLGSGPEGPVGVALLRSPVARYFAYMRKNTLFCADTDNGRLLVLTPQGESFGIIESGTLFRPRQIALDSHNTIYVTVVHAHTPVWSSRDTDKPHIWEIERNCAWVMAYGKNGAFLGRIGAPAAHDHFDHEGAGLHWHGDGIAVDKSDDHMLYVQGHNLVFKLRVDVGAVALPSGGIPITAPQPGHSDASKEEAR